MKLPFFLLRLKEKLILKFRKKPKEKKEKIPQTCQKMNCKTKLNLINAFYCHYCYRYHCKKHRLPEDHNCKGNPKNPHKQGTADSLIYHNS